MDPRDLTKVLWSIAPQGQNGAMGLGPGRPTLQGSSLLLTDNVATIAMYDTGAAPDGAPVKRWAFTMGTAPQDDHRLPPPVLVDGTVYAAWWVYATTDGYQQLWLWQLNAATGVGTQTKIDATFTYTAPQDFQVARLGQNPPVLARVPGAAAGQTRTMLYVNGHTTVWGVDVAAPNPPLSYTLPSSSSGGAVVTIASGFGYGGEQLWFGDIGATLYGLDAQLQPLPHTPAPLASGTDLQQIVTTPVVYTDAHGQTAVLLGVADATGNKPGDLLAFDPGSGNVVAIPIGPTIPLRLTPTVANGVLYVAGNVSAEGGISETFGIRVDEAVQELRDFVVDSQLMQDFDPAPAGQSRPANTNGSARYQTHLTLVDGQKAPLPHEAVKIWADQPATLQVNGVTVQVGPGDSQFTVAQTGTDGVVTIVSGTLPDAGGADKADLFAVPLRVWAPFMNPYERIVVQPDREFHNRVATAHATTSPSDPAYDDPTKVNLSTATNNAGAPLFNAQDKQNNQPQQAAQAMQNMTGSIGSGTAPAGVARTRTLRGAAAAWVRRVSATAGSGGGASIGAGSGKYLAYADLPGAGYSPTNTPTARPVVVIQPAGLSLSNGPAGTAPTGYAALAPAVAAAAIDAMTGQPWEQSVHAPAHVRAAAQAGGLGAARLGDWWSDFWNWLKGAVATVAQVVVSVADDIYVGIQLIVDKVVTVFRAVITALEQAVSAIGAFFKALVKIIEDVIEALSILFQFGEVIKTYNFLKQELLNRVNGVPGNANYPGFANVVSGTVIPTVDGFFKQGEQAIGGFFNTLADQLGGGATLSGLKGGGATAHSTFTVAPKGGGQASSQATQSTWALQKLKGGMGSGGGSASVAARPRAGATADPIAALFDGIATRLSGDGDLSAQWQKVQAGLTSLGTSSSAGDFLSKAMAELLRVLALLLDGAVAIANAFADGLLQAFASVVTLLFDAQSGLLTEALDIPVLSWLYELLFGEKLTFLNAITLVIAIPVTLVWKIAEGQWPSQSVGAVAGPRGVVGALPPVIGRIVGVASAFLTICLGFIFGFGDAMGSESPPPLVGKLALACSFLNSGCAFPLASNATPTDFDWLGWGLGLAAGALNLLGSIELTSGGAAEEIFTVLGPGLLSVLSLAQLAVFVEQFLKDALADPVGSAALGVGIAATIPGVINPIKLFDEIPALIVAALDVAMGFAVAITVLVENFES